ncbi:uncharacterized protein LOC143429731 [Xylocopa sonorina]|uniref:uncharacterized protein LOC143429731 n=1 Tax=Xylocopa sonorina TaxID=1818115 RepID=UPI00403A8E84
MRITSILLYKVHDIPYRFRGKYGKIKKPTLKDIIEFKNDLEREERNMLILRHPYLTVEQSRGHMSEFKREKFINILHKWTEDQNEKFNKRITIQDRLSHLKVNEAWD